MWLYLYLEMQCLYLLFSLVSLCLMVVGYFPMVLGCDGVCVAMLSLVVCHSCPLVGTGGVVAHGHCGVVSCDWFGKLHNEI